MDYKDIFILILTAIIVGCFVFTLTMVFVLTYNNNHNFINPIHFLRQDYFDQYIDSYITNYRYSYKDIVFYKNALTECQTEVTNFTHKSEALDNEIVTLTSEIDELNRNIQYLDYLFRKYNYDTIQALNTTG